MSARLAAVIGILTGLLVAATVVLLAATRDAPLPDSWGFRGAQVLAGATCGAVGFVVATRRPENRIGWIFETIGLLFAIEGFVEAYAIASVTIADTALPGMPGITWVLTWMWVPSVFLALVFLPLLFPTGRLLSPTWRPAAWLGAVGLVGVSIAAAVTPGPIQQTPLFDNPLVVPGYDLQFANAITGIAIIPIVGAIGLAVVSLVRRYRSSSDEIRRQIRWFAFAAGLAGPVFALYVISYLLGLPDVISRSASIAVLAAILAMPVAAGIAILRYRLYEIDRIISRTISYGVVTSLLVGAYALAILVLQGPLASLTGGQTIAVALSTLVAAALFQPLRVRVQRAVDRRFDRARFDAERTSASFAERLRVEVDIDAVTDDLRDTVRRSIKPAGLGLWLRGGGR